MYKPRPSSYPDVASLADGTANLHVAAEVILEQIRILASAPTNGRAFLVADVYGRGTHTPTGDAFVQTIFSGLHDLHRGINSTGKGEAAGAGPKLNVAFAEFSRIWDGVLGPDPGFAAFGYVSTDACIVDCSDTFCSTEGMCDDPDHYFYYIPGCVSPVVGFVLLLGEEGEGRGERRPRSSFCLSRIWSRSSGISTHWPLYERNYLLAHDRSSVKSIFTSIIEEHGDI